MIIWIKLKYKLIIQLFLLILYFHRIFILTVSVPYRNQFSVSKFSKTTRQILNVKKDSVRARFTLPENIFIFNFCRAVFENFDSKN